MEDAIEWWDNLTNAQQTQCEKDFGIYGHDMGTTYDEVLDMYKYYNKKEIQREKRINDLLK